MPCERSVPLGAVVLHERADPRPTHRVRAPTATVRHAWAIGVMASVVVFTGTIVTASGPHGGDEDVERLSVDLPDAARVHGISVVVLVATTLALLRRLHRADATRLRRRVEILVAVMLAQAGVGYVQYFNELPVLLVAIHIAGATALWIAVVQLVLAARGLEGPGSPDAPTTGSQREPSPTMSS